MKKVARIVGICSREVQARYLAASERERAELQSVIEREKDWMIRKMGRKGYELEATIAGVYGVFTRGPARGQLRLLQDSTADAR